VPEVDACSALLRLEETRLRLRPGSCPVVCDPESMTKPYE